MTRCRFNMLHPYLGRASTRCNVYPASPLNATSLERRLFGKYAVRGSEPPRDLSMPFQHGSGKAMVDLMLYQHYRSAPRTSIVIAAHPFQPTD